MSNVILINPFEVPAQADDDQFLRGWQHAADLLRTKPGFGGARLHRALSAEARFGFVNIAEWESPHHFQTAVEDEAFAKLALNSPPNYPALYELVRSI